MFGRSIRRKSHVLKEGLLMSKLALHADLCYNRGTKLLRRNDALTSFRQLTRSVLRRRAMDNIVPQDSMPRKKCTGPCGRTLPATTEYFYAHDEGKGGLNPRCKQCVCARVNAHKRAHPDEHRLQMKAYNHTHAAEKRDKQAIYRQANPDQKRIWSDAHIEEQRAYRRIHIEDI